ncbi:MAG: hypothetical protein GY696_01445 [Gammaproteobacteria bacterium]|nr:hypothetical protein [Gammaproteobacteria bacterium]
MAESESVIKATEQGQLSDNTRSKSSELFPGIGNERDIFKSQNRVARSPVVSPYNRPLVFRSDDGIRVITTTPTGVEVRNLHQGIRPPVPRANPLVPPPHTANLSTPQQGIQPIPRTNPFVPTPAPQVPQESLHRHQARVPEDLRQAH